MAQQRYMAGSAPVYATASATEVEPSSTSKSDGGLTTALYWIGGSILLLGIVYLIMRVIKR